MKKEMYEMSVSLVINCNKLVCVIIRIQKAHFIKGKTASDSLLTTDQQGAYYKTETCKYTTAFQLFTRPDQARTELQVHVVAG